MKDFELPEPKLRTEAIEGADWHSDGRWYTADQMREAVAKERERADAFNKVAHLEQLGIIEARNAEIERLKEAVAKYAELIKDAEYLIDRFSRCQEAEDYQMDIDHWKDSARGKA